jgi:general secretion pathway protein G
MSFVIRFLQTKFSKGQTGFSLLELITTLAVLAILVMGTIPLAQNAVKRQKEMQLREYLRQMRNAIDEFKRDTNGACPLGAVTSTNPADPNRQNVPADPRSRVIIDDCEIFDNTNIDRYPPSLDVLVEGVKVKARGLNSAVSRGAFSNTNATELGDATKEVNKIYLREIPVDPFTGEKDWQLRSSYQTKDDGSWDSINVFDVRSNSREQAFNGDNYSDW